MTKKSILEEAQELVYGDRAKQYGPWSYNAANVARIFTATTHHELSPKEITLFMVSLKLARETTKHKRDNLVDICGYLELYNQLCEDDDT